MAFDLVQVLDGTGLLHGGDLDNRRVTGTGAGCFLKDEQDRIGDDFCVLITARHRHQRQPSPIGQEFAIGVSGRVNDPDLAFDPLFRFALLHDLHGQRFRRLRRLQDGHCRKRQERQGRRPARNGE